MTRVRMHQHSYIPFSTNPPLIRCTQCGDLTEGTNMTTTEDMTETTTLGEGSRKLRHEALRPQVLADLPTHYQSGAQVVSVSLGDLPVDSVLVAFSKALELVGNRDGFITSNSYGTVSVSKVLTEQELADRLESANNQWDRDRDRYEAALEAGVYVEDWSTRTAIKEYAKKMGIELPTALVSE
jgi:hypothetical protein